MKKKGGKSEEVRHEGRNSDDNSTVESISCCGGAGEFDPGGKGFIYEPAGSLAHRNRIGAVPGQMARPQLVPGELTEVKIEGIELENQNWMIYHRDKFESEAICGWKHLIE